MMPLAPSTRMDGLTASGSDVPSKGVTKVPGQSGTTSGSRDALINRRLEDVETPNSSTPHENLMSLRGSRVKPVNCPKTALVASVGVAILAGLYGLTGIGKEARLLRHTNREHDGFCGQPKEAEKIFVDKSGSGDARSVQEAVDAVKGGNKKRVTIYIAAGTYVEKVLVPSNKPYITFQGRGRESTVITWNDNANATNSTFKTASVSVEADHFIARNISFKNSAPRPGPAIVGAQAIALQVLGDKIAFYGCGMYGHQDTLNDHQGRHYFQDCHIEGMVDFVFGNARSLYKKCTIKSNADGWGAITAHSRVTDLEVTGFSFVQCSVVGTGKIYLGRAWRSYSRVVFASTYMEDVIDSRGWDDWGNKSADMTVFYGEYKNTGPGANMGGRVAYARTLTLKEAATYTQMKWINGSEWLQGEEK